MSSVSKKRQQQQQEPSEQSHPPQQNLSSSSTHRSESQFSTSQRNNNNNNNNSSIARYSPPQPEDDERRAVVDDRDEAPNSPPPPLPQQQQPSPANQLPSSSVSSSRPSAAAVVAPVASVDDIQLQDLDVDTPPRGGTPSSSSLPHPVPAAQQQQQQQLSATPAAQTRPISSADTNTSIASTVPRGMTTDDRPLLGSGGGGEPQPSSSSAQQQQQTQQRTPPYGSVGTAVAHPGLAAYPYCVAIVNPASGERSAAQFVFDCLCEELGPDRVLRLDGAVFRNPAPIRLLVEKALRPDGERGTVLVSGGDGTVAFVMAQLDAIAEQYGIQASAPRSDGGRGGAEGEEEESPEARQEEDERLLGMHRSPPLSAADAPPPPPASSTPIRLPAVGVLALGTGNDFSNCMGFGNGYTKRPCCCMCICCINRVSSIVKEIVQCPAIPFDRWVATMGPADEDVTSPVPPKTTIFMNYFSLGMDAFIATKFDGLRRAYPSCFQYRFQNKGWYGALGMYGAMKCDRLNKSVPKLSLVTAKSVLKNASSSSSSSAPSKQRHQDPNDAQNNLPAASPNNNHNEGQLSTVLPPKTKALVLSNVDSYSGGTKLWADGNKGSKYCATRTPSKVSINDHLLEVQALGGLVDMTMLQMKLGNGADKIAQVKECEILVGGSMKEPVPVQADGEPMGALTSATKIVVKRYEKLVYVRCRRSEVDSTASVGLGRK